MRFICNLFVAFTSSNNENDETWSNHCFREDQKFQHEHQTGIAVTEYLRSTLLTTSSVLFKYLTISTLAIYHCSHYIRTIILMTARKHNNPAIVSMRGVLSPWSSLHQSTKNDSVTCKRHTDAGQGRKTVHALSKKSHHKFMCWNHSAINYQEKMFEVSQKTSELFLKLLADVKSLHAIDMRYDALSVFQLLSIARLQSQDTMTVQEVIQKCRSQCRS